MFPCVNATEVLLVVHDAELVVVGKKTGTALLEVTWNQLGSVDFLLFA